VTMAEFCRLLWDCWDSLDRPAIDKTGIPGRFDLHLDLTPADLGHAGFGLRDPAATAAPLLQATQLLKCVLQYRRWD
jgi:uncharacterized protein (TIGR03435 family)